MTDPKVSGEKEFLTEKQLLAFLDTLIDGWGLKTDIRYKAIRAAIEERERLRIALDRCLYYLPSFGDPKGLVQIEGPIRRVVDIRKYVTALLGSDLKLDGEEGK